MNFNNQKPHYEHLKRKWKTKAEKAENNLWDKHGKHLKQLALGSLGGLMLLTSPTQAISPIPNQQVSRDDALKNYDQSVLLADKLKNIVPSETRPLNPDEESQITKTLSSVFGFRVMAEIDDVRLNRNFGTIGGEQHLYRYPGDNVYAHTDTSSDWAMYGTAGIAPGLGAWGYFASSKESFGEKDKKREKYYLAIQTFLIPGFAENFGRLRDFFKYRKMIVVNPHSGQAVVAVIGDAGPSQWTGKHLGGSPEVMETLGLATGPRKGEVLYFFVDDPEDKIPLGPIKTRMEI